MPACAVAPMRADLLNISGSMNRWPSSDRLARASIWCVCRPVQQWSAEVKLLLTRLNRIIERAGVSFALRLPSERFNRRFGPFAGAAYTPEGEPLNANLDGASGSPFLPTDTDRDLLRAVMQPVLEPGRIAGWIAPPARGINSLPALDYDYVRF